MQKYFQISFHALLVSAFMALAFTGRLDAPAIILFTLSLGVSVYRTVNRLPPLITTRGGFFLSCTYISFFIVDIVAISGSFVSATIHLVLFLELAKLFQEKTDKDYLYLIILAFLQVLAASSLTIDMSFVAALFLFLVALISTLMSFDMYRSERNGATQERAIGVHLGGMSVWATLWIIITATVLFFVIPRVGAGFFSRVDKPALLLSGFTESVHLGDIGQVKLGSAVVMHARQISGTPYAVLKWRGISLDMFDGRSWYKTDRKRTPIRRSPDGQYRLSSIQSPADLVQYEIFLEPLATTTLFGPYHVRSLWGRLDNIETDRDDSVFMRLQTPGRLQYSVLSEVPNRARLLSAPAPEDGDSPQISAKYLQLPTDLDPRIPQLANEITARGRSTMDKASLVETYLKRNYKYTLNLTWNPGPQPIATFLFDAKAGHCEYFASSMAILLRAAGIPTRLVNGFLMGEYNPVGGDYIIRQSDAHSWVEVWVPGGGWFEFDPTPPDPNLREVDLALQFSQYMDAMQFFWNSYVLTYDRGAQVLLFHSAQDTLQSIQLNVRRIFAGWMIRGRLTADHFSLWLRQWIETAWFWIAVVAAVTGVLAFRNRKVLRIQLQIWRLRQGSGAVSQEIVERLFYRAVRLAGGRTQERKPAETWREWIFGLPDPNRRSILTRALEIFEKSKYGHIQVSSSEFALLQETIRELNT